MPEYNKKGHLHYSAGLLYGVCLRYGQKFNHSEILPPPSPNTEAIVIQLHINESVTIMSVAAPRELFAMRSRSPDRKR
jgi:hypothetical protein